MGLTNLWVMVEQHNRQTVKLIVTALSYNTLKDDKVGVLVKPTGYRLTKEFTFPELSR